MSVADKKQRDIHRILHNELWGRFCGLYERLAVALNKLPADALRDLAMVVDQKEIEASRRARELAAQPAQENTHP